MHYSPTAIGALKTSGFDVGIVAVSTHICVGAGIWSRGWVFVNEPIEAATRSIAPHARLGTNSITDRVTNELIVEGFQRSGFGWQTARSDADGAGIFGISAAIASSAHVNIVRGIGQKSLQGIRWAGGEGQDPTLGTCLCASTRNKSRWAVFDDRSARPTAIGGRPIEHNRGGILRNDVDRLSGQTAQGSKNEFYKLQTPGILLGIVTDQQLPIAVCAGFVVVKIEERFLWQIRPVNEGGCALVNWGTGTGGKTDITLAIGAIGHTVIVFPATVVHGQNNSGPIGRNQANGHVGCPLVLDAQTYFLEVNVLSQNRARCIVDPNVKQVGQEETLVVGAGKIPDRPSGIATGRVR